MAKFVKIATSSTRSVYVNLDNVTLVEPLREGAYRIFFTKDHHIDAVGDVTFII